MKNGQLQPEKMRFLVLTVAGLIGGALLISSFISAGNTTAMFCSLAGGGSRSQSSPDQNSDTTRMHLNAILHYATSRVVPQQSLGEIRVSFDVLQSLSPCNFLVFGLGHDSLMWASFNPGGTTLFLEEDPKWVQTVLKDAPTLHARTVHYRTKLSEADSLMASYRSEPDCSPSKSFIRGNDRCNLALTGLPEEVYDTEWDLIMIDAPRGYFAEAPGRMAAIYSAAVMARNRKKSGVTHVFLHDVDRKVEKAYAEEFLCRSNLVKAEGRLWHFVLPPAANVSGSSGGWFC